jgi:putative endonuclease
LAEVFDAIGKQMHRLISEAQRLVPGLRRGLAVVYLLRLRSGCIYVGASTDLGQRLLDHESGRACRTTRIDVPAVVLRIETHPTFADARAREAQLKGWTRAKKEALVGGDLRALRRLARSRDTPSERT